MPQRSPRARDDSSPLGIYLDEMGGIPLLGDADVVRLASGLRDARRAIATSAQALPESCRAIALAGDESGPALGAAWPLADVETFFRKLPGTSSPRTVVKLKAHKRALDLARDGLIRGNLRLVVHVARKYVNRGLPLIDLIQEGNVGLLRAVEKFEHERGNKFSTYAYWWVKQSIERGLAEKTRSIRVPVHVVGRMRQVGFASRDLTRRLGRKPSSGEIAAQLGMPVDSVERAMSVVREPSPLEHPPGDPTGLDLSKTIPDDSAPSPYEEAVKRQLGRRLDSILARLNPREEEIVRLRFGIGHDDTRTLEQIGRKLRITRERVRQIESVALSKIKRSVRGRELAGLFGIGA